MRLKEDKLPSEEEAKTETEKRLRLIEEIRPEFEKFCEIMIIVGSVAFGKNYSVRKESDIDILLLLNRNMGERIKDFRLIEMTPKYEEALECFLSGEVDHFSVEEEMKGVKMQYHFWDKEAHFRAELGEYVPKVYNIWRTESDFEVRGIDLEGKEKTFTIPLTKKCKYGVIHNFNSFYEVSGKMIISIPITNILSGPDIVFCKDKRIYENIEEIWNRVAERFVEEGVEYDSVNPLKFLTANWSFSPESKKKMVGKFNEALRKQSYDFTS